MEPLFIEGTDLTPTISLDPVKGYFEIEGYSRPEDVNEFYTPVVEWLRDYKEKNINNKLKAGYESNELNFVFKLTYFNSASTKFITEVLFIIRDLNKNNKQINISWYYEEYDEDMLEVGEDLSAMIKIPFNYYAMDEEDDEELDNIID